MQGKIVNEITLRCLINGGGQNKREDRRSLSNLINGRVKINGGRGGGGSEFQNIR